MSDPLEPLRRAVELMDRRVTLGTPTAGHYCATCDDYTLIVADLVRLDHGGPTSFGIVCTCPNCC